MLVLIVDGGGTVLPLAGDALAAAGFRAVQAADCNVALEIAAAQPPDVIVVDCPPAGLSVPELCRLLKRTIAVQVRVVCLGAQASEEERVQAFIAGVDDFVSRPFSARELALRCRVLASRRGPRSPQPGATLRLGPFRLEAATWRAYRDGVELRLPRKQFELLTFLMMAPNRLHTREALRAALYEDGTVGARTVDICVARLRAKLRPFEGWLQTVRARGYRLASPRLDLNA